MAAALLSLLFLLSLTHYAACDVTRSTSDGLETWGYTDVRTGAHLFWWLYYSPKDFDRVQHHSHEIIKSIQYHSTETSEIDGNKPLIMWLQGGPGASGVGYGNFEEIGPLRSDLSPREYTWLKSAHLLFVDNPVGTGFSYVDDGSYYTTTNAEVVADLITFLKTFFENTFKFKNSKFYVVCESYGGKFTSELAVALYEEIQNGSLSINFGGIAMGDSWISPIDFMKAWGQQLRTLSLVDDNEKNLIDEFALKAEDAIQEGNYSSATDLWSTQEQLIEELTDDVDFYNVLLHNIEDDDSSSSSSLFLHKLNFYLEEFYHFWKFKPWSLKKAGKFQNYELKYREIVQQLSKERNIDLNFDLDSTFDHGITTDSLHSKPNINRIKHNPVSINQKFSPASDLSHPNQYREESEEQQSFGRGKKALHPNFFHLAKRRLLKFENDDLALTMNGAIRKKLQIIPPSITWSVSSLKVFDFLYEDFMKPTIDMVDKALSLGINVTIYSGQLDLICCTDGTENWMKKLKWEYLNDFFTTSKSPLYCSDQRITAAFSKKYKNLSFFWIMQAGHMVPADNPCIALKMIDIITGD